MLRKLPALVFCFIFASGILSPLPAMACGHDGVYFGMGYNQLFMFTPENQYTAIGGSTPRVTFGAGYGANGVIGYDFCGSRWGFQIPFEFSRQRLNKSEWVNLFLPSAEAVFHLAAWDNGIDVHLVGGAGFAYLSEGAINDNSESAGIVGSLGPGLSYYFESGPKLSAALVLELPFRIIYFFGNHLSANGTALATIPIRLSIQLGF